MSKIKPPEVIQQENDEVTETSLGMMEELLESSRNNENHLNNIFEVLSDCAGFLEQLVEGLEEED